MQSKLKDLDFNNVALLCNNLMEFRHIRAVVSKPVPRGNIDAVTLAKRWCIGIDTALSTLQCTTQKAIRNSIHPIARRYRTKQQMLKYNMLNTKM